MTEADLLERIETARREGVTELDLSGQGLTSLPPEIGSLSRLEVLDLAENQLTTVPRELGQLANLRHLNLSGNQLTAVPVELGQLANLTHLSLHGNRLTAVPPELGRLAKLRVLEVGDNPRMKSPPPEIVEEGVERVLSYLRDRLYGYERQASHNCWWTRWRRGWSRSGSRIPSQGNFPDQKRMDKDKESRHRTMSP